MGLMKQIAIEIENAPEHIKYMMHEIELLKGDNDKLQNVDKITLKALALKIKFLEDKVITDVKRWGEQMVHVDSKLDEILPLLKAFLPRIEVLEAQMKQTIRFNLSPEDKAQLKVRIETIKEKWAKES